MVAKSLVSSCRRAADPICIARGSIDSRPRAPPGLANIASGIAAMVHSNATDQALLVSVDIRENIVLLLSSSSSCRLLC